MYNVRQPDETRKTVTNRREPSPSLFRFYTATRTRQHNTKNMSSIYSNSGKFSFIFYQLFLFFVQCSLSSWPDSLSAFRINNDDGIQFFFSFFSYLIELGEIHRNGGSPCRVPPLAAAFKIIRALPVIISIARQPSSSKSNYYQRGVP